MGKFKSFCSGAMFVLASITTIESGAMLALAGLIPFIVFYGMAWLFVICGVMIFNDTSVD